MGDVVLGGVITLVVSVVTLWVSHTVQRRRDREAWEAERRTRLEEERRLRRREALYRIQDVLVSLCEPGVKLQRLERATYRTGDFDLPDGWMDRAPGHILELAALKARIRDPRLNERLDEVIRSTRFVIDVSDNPLDFGEGLMGLATRFESTNKQVEALLAVEDSHEGAGGSPEETH